MANLDGVKIEKAVLGANTFVKGDGISGMIIEVNPESTLNLEINEIVYNLKDVENLGITKEFDKTEKVNVYRHLVEFYRMAGEGTELHLMFVQGKTLAEIIEDSSEGADDSLAKKFIISAEGKIRQLAFCLNPSVAPTELNGINADVFGAIPKAQGLAKWSYDNHFPLHIILEGRDYVGNASSVQNLREISNVKGTKVSVVIGQDYKYASSLQDELQKKFADVGTCLGTISKARVEQNIGNNEEFNITDVTKGAWEVAGLSNNKKIEEQFSDLQTLENKGYIFGITYTGIEGVRWNNDHTCAEVVADANNNLNESSISYSRVMDKAVRLLRTGFLPKVKTNQPVDPSTGKLPAGVVKYFDSIGDGILEGMIARGEITQGKTSVNPDSDLLKEKSLKVSFSIVPVGCVGEIIGTISLKNSIN